MIELKKDDLRLLISSPGVYYRGTRFDRAGVFRLIEKRGYVYADRWFDGDDPYVHDHVCGPSEEFVTVDFDGVPPGGVFVKPGVGLLQRPQDNSPYDWFHLYWIVDEGRWSESVTEESVEFRQVLDGWYDYRKTIRITSPSSFGIFHHMEWHAPKPLSGYFYNHNFFTFGGAEVGPDRRVDFPYHPVGTWRDRYSSVALDGNGIRFSSQPDLPSVYMGDLHSAEGVTPYSFRLSDRDRAVEVEGSEPLDHIVFWSNRRVACPEPYMALRLEKGESRDWSVEYELR